MLRDPIVEEVHRARAALWRKCGGTLEGLFRYLQEREAAHPERLVSKAVSPRRGRKPRKRARSKRG